jgi:hypothetical protein
MLARTGLLALPKTSIVAMDKHLFESLWGIFVEKERQTFLKGKRRYLHFDNKIGFSTKILRHREEFLEIFNRKFKKDFQSPEELSKSYYPFIKLKISIPRYKWDDKLKKKVTIPKERPICYASHFDALRYAWYSTVLDYCYEETLKHEDFNESILAYRKFDNKLSNIDFAFKAFDEIAVRKSCVALAFDVSKFFETINHQVLYANWMEVVKVIYGPLSQLPEQHYMLYKNITKFQFINKNTVDDIFAFKSLHETTRTRICEPNEFRTYIADSKLLETNEYFVKYKDRESGGIPQGSPISAVLANISMVEFDKVIYSFMKSIEGCYYRYSDDLLFICDLKHETLVEQKVVELIALVGLKVNASKIEKVRFTESVSGNIIASDETGQLKKLQYLGFEYDGKNIYIRSSSLAKYHSRLHRVINRTVNMAYGKKGQGKNVFKKKLLKRFTKNGKQNFIYYAKRAGEIKSKSGSIQNQYKNQFKHLNKTIVRKVDRKMERKME